MWCEALLGWRQTICVLEAHADEERWDNVVAMVDIPAQALINARKEQQCDA
jgi:hypothetical protein